MITGPWSQYGHERLCLERPFCPESRAVAQEWGTGRRLYRSFMLNRDDFLSHYHKRSNVETAFSMIRGKFGDAVRS